jgi:two-component sensor histidine kinase
VAGFETVRRRRDGTLVEVSLTFSPLRDRSGALVGASTIMRDITAQQECQKELRRANFELAAQVRARTCELKDSELRLQEIHHRVKNNLQVISSLINLQIRSVADVATRAALRQCQSRVAAMCQIHEVLHQSQDYARVALANYARDLAGRVLTASGLAPHTVTLHFALDDLSVAVDKAIPCGLILHELLSNALEHAFPDGRCGMLSVELRQLDDDRVLLAVSDSGVGIPAQVEPERALSLGLHLVTALVKQLAGTLQIDRASGTAFRVTFPADTRA